jgi:hypothetical protein
MEWPLSWRWRAGYAAGVWSSLGPAVQRGYADVSTDAGHSQNNSGDASAWALVSSSNVNQYLLLDFASRSIHEMTVLGNSVTEAFYTTKPAYSYWQGCSTGSRQGLGEAQTYPEDYDDIVAAAPAVQWNDFVSLLPQSVGRENLVCHYGEMVCHFYGEICFAGISVIAQRLITREYGTHFDEYVRVAIFLEL